MSSLSAFEFVSEDFWSPINAEALMTKSAANAEKTRAVNAEKNKWQSQVNNLINESNAAKNNLSKAQGDLKTSNSKIQENQNTIKTLQANLDNAIKESKKLAESKSESEKLASRKLNEAKSETQKIVNEMQNLKLSSEENSKKLNKEISDLQNDIKMKEQEKLDLDTKLNAAIKSRKEYEAKAESEKNSVKLKFDEEKKKLNLMITQKTKQLSAKNAELKKLKTDYSLQNINSQSAEAINLIDIDIFKNETAELKTDLRNLVEEAKRLDAERDKREIALLKKNEADRKHYTEIISKNQAIELKNMKEIDKLKSEMKELLDKFNEALTIGKQMESKYKAKIVDLLKNLKLAKSEYSSTVEANKIAELKNLALIDDLRSKLEEAANLNKFLINKAKQTALAKAKEDSADSHVEVKRLIKIDNLETILKEAVAKNKILIDACNEIAKTSSQRSTSEKEAELKYLQTIDKLTTNLNLSNKVLNEIRENNNNNKWIVQKNFFDKSDIPAIVISPNARGENFQYKTFKKQPKFKHKNVIPPYIPQIQSENSKFMSEIPQSQGQFNNPIKPPYIPQIQSENSKFMNEIPQSQEPFNNQFVEQAMPQNNQEHETITQIKQMQVEETKEDQLVNFAIESILNAILKMTNGDIDKTNSSMNLLGSGTELPKKLDAVIKVITEQFDSKILYKALTKISKMHNNKKSFLEKSLNYIYGEDGYKLILWNEKINY